MIIEDSPINPTIIVRGAIQREIRIPLSTVKDVQDFDISEPTAHKVTVLVFVWEKRISTLRHVYRYIGSELF